MHSKQKPVVENHKLEAINIQEPDDLSLAGRDDLVWQNEWLALNELPTSRLEEETMKKWQAKLKKLEFETMKNLDKLAMNFSFETFITRELGKKIINPKASRSYKGRKLQNLKIKSEIEKMPQNLEDSQISEPEMSRAVGTIENLPFHHFYDGSEIWLDRKPVPDIEFQTAENEEKKEKPELMTSKYLTIGYANVPFHKVKKKSVNIIQEIIDEAPEVDIWLFCEMYWSEKSPAQIPAGYLMHTHKIMKEKITMIMYKAEIQELVKNVKSSFTETTITVLNPDELHLTVVYRPPDNKSPPYKKLKNRLNKMGKESAMV